MENIRVTVWNEYTHEKDDSQVAAIYPEGIHGAIADSLRQRTSAQIKTVTMYDEGQGLTDEVLDNTDVLVYWAHKAHSEITDENAQRIKRRVLEGMGLIALHSAHASKMFSLLMGTETRNLRWREEGEMERLWVVSPGHPIAQGIGEYFEIEKEETYGEYFNIPEPDELVFISWFSGGEVFRSGCCFKRGAGRIFYFRPGHETYPIYHDENVQKVIANAVGWAVPAGGSHVCFTSGKCPVSPEELRKNG